MVSFSGAVMTSRQWRTRAQIAVEHRIDEKSVGRMSKVQQPPADAALVATAALKLSQTGKAHCGAAVRFRASAKGSIDGRWR